jgi:hypothetical protein
VRQRPGGDAPDSSRTHRERQRCTSNALVGQRQAPCTTIFKRETPRASSRATGAAPGRSRSDGDARDVADLVAFLKSIDQTTPPFAVPEGDELCLGE